MNRDYSNAAQRILITAGPTIEPLDPVRFISSRSTGTMGYTIARVCAEHGFEVSLISGPVSLPSPGGVTLVKVETASQMELAVMKRINNCDCLIMAAAVSDFRPEVVSGSKIKKQDQISLKLVKNTDILEALKEKEILKVGFALETENSIENAREKLENKRLDIIVVNKIEEGKSPFGETVNDYTILEKSGGIIECRKCTKEKLARILISKIGNLMAVK